MKLTFDDITKMKEALASSQIEGIGTNLTLNYLIEAEMQRRTTKNKWVNPKTKKKLKPKEVAEILEGENEYLGDYWIPAMDKVCTCFYNANPNRDKGHLDYPFLFYKDSSVYVSAVTAEEWDKLEKYKL